MIIYYSNFNDEYSMKLYILNQIKMSFNVIDLFIKIYKKKSY